MSDDRTKILQRILNLRARADNEASSESEVNAALSLCAKLMDSYNVAEVDLVLAEAQGEIKLEIVSEESEVSVLTYASPERRTKPQQHASVLVVTALAKFTETRAVFNTWTGIVTFTGHKPDVVFANYLLSMIREALEHEYQMFRKTAGAVGYGAKKSFQRAMACRISNRLADMAREREEEWKRGKTEAILVIESDQSVDTKTALIIADLHERKKEEVESAFALKHTNIRKVSTNSNARNYTAHGAGTRAGNNVNFGRPVGHSTMKAIANA